VDSSGKKAAIYWGTCDANGIKGTDANILIP
jgi:hypothetical protein